ncbi:DoxX family protein [Nocardia amikacinitolerans]|uniref:DoxX family protein n=1 Tax=Nocardia amikacinitolerans TaxID=756689 RepID=UPI0020A46076|nr:DoxX family protein [Nocardia amikacinitolerans]MCP2275188.1 DoxX-like family protein [Nocardia amikacinitolerans]
MNIALWIVAGLLAVVYVAAGLAKLAQPYEKLTANPSMGWAREFSPGAVRLIGAAELLGAAGLILPRATGIAVILTPLAALGLAALQVGAMQVHYRRGETKNLPMNMVLLLLALFVAIGRFADWG